MLGRLGGAAYRRDGRGQGHGTTGPVRRVRTGPMVGRSPLFPLLTPYAIVVRVENGRDILSPRVLRAPRPPPAPLHNSRRRWRSDPQSEVAASARGGNAGPVAVVVAGLSIGVTPSSVEPAAVRDDRKRVADHVDSASAKHHPYEGSHFPHPRPRSAGGRSLGDFRRHGHPFRWPVPILSDANARPQPSRPPNRWLAAAMRWTPTGAGGITRLRAYEE